MRQNFKHTKTLAALLNLPAAVFHSVVVFGDAATLKNRVPENVAQLAAVTRHIRGYTADLLPPEKVAGLVEAIQRCASTVDAAAKKRHVAKLRRRHTG